jgi:CheY-like chemotaxis protein
MPKFPRILLVEDDRRDIELMLEAFKESHMMNEVMVVRDGEEALDYLYSRGDFLMRIQGNPAVVLLDLKIPKIDGLEILKQIKSDPHLKKIPVVILTSSRVESDLIESYNLNANAYVVKPVLLDNFLLVIKNIGVFWGLINEPPPGTVKKPTS